MCDEFVGKLIYQWKVPTEYREARPQDDIPEEYRVYQYDQANCGIIIYALSNGKWICNPYSVRALVFNLLKGN